MAIVAMTAIGLQFFLAGVGIFGAGSIEMHRVTGYLITLTAVLLLVLALTGGLGRDMVGFSAALLVLLIIQIALIESRQPWIEALHPLNALAILGVTAQLVMRGRGALKTRDDAASPAIRRAPEE